MKKKLCISIILFLIISGCGTVKKAVDISADSTDTPTTTENNVVVP